MQIEKLSPANRKILLQRLLYRAFFIGILTIVIAPMCYFIKGMEDFEFTYALFWLLVISVDLIAFPMPCLDLLYNKKIIAIGRTVIDERYGKESGVYHVLEIYTDEGLIEIYNDGVFKHIVPQTVQTIHYARFSKIIFQVDGIEMV